MKRNKLLLLLLLLGLISSACNLPSHSTSGWEIEWGGPSNEGATGWAYFRANGALEDG